MVEVFWPSGMIDQMNTQTQKSIFEAKFEVNSLSQKIEVSFCSESASEKELRMQNKKQSFNVFQGN